MYYKYWNLKKPPFDNVPDPKMYAECHTSMENAIAETLFAIEEGKECIAVIVGDVGLGKTMSIRIIIDYLNQEKYKIALITNPSTTFVQILREVIGQLTGKQCEEKTKVDLLEIFNKLLFENIDKGKKILIFIDEANAISPANLENLRLLTNMQDDKRNLFTMVLVGQMELARRLEHPKLANLFQRIGTYNRIDKIQTEELLKNYVETRLRLAGTTRKIFRDGAFRSLWKYSEYGIPRLINKICKLSLKAGETNKLDEINEEVVNQIGERFRKITGPVAQKMRYRTSLKERTIPVPVKDKKLSPENILVDQKKKDFESVNETGKLLKTTTLFEYNDYETKETSNQNSRKNTELTTDNSDSKELPFPFAEGNLIIGEDSEEVEIGEHKVRVNFPSDFTEKVKTSTRERHIKLSGIMAAQILKDNPQLTKDPFADPVYIWEKIKDFILSRIEQINSVV